MSDNNNMRLQEGAEVVAQTEAKSDKQVRITTVAASALLALALTAGHPVPAKAETPTASNNTAAFVINANYEKIIAEAKKQGKDPVEYASEKGMKDDVLMELDEYINRKNKQAAITRRAEERKIDQASIEVKAKIDSATEQINTKAMSNLRMIAGIYGNDANVFSKKPEWRAYIFEIYSNQQGHYKPETVQYVVAHFPKIIQNGTTIAMNIN